MGTVGYFQSISTEWMHSAIVDVDVDSVLEDRKDKGTIGKVETHAKRTT